MKGYSPWPLALVFALGLPGVFEAADRIDNNTPITSGAAESTRTRTTAGSPSQDTVAWECVPNYWLSYWAWAWQPCPWLDRAYVQGAIGAVADASQELAPKPETSAL